MEATAPSGDFAKFRDAVKDGITAITQDHDPRTARILGRLLVAADVFAFYAHQDPTVRSELTEYMTERAQDKEHPCGPDLFSGVLAGCHYVLPDLFHGPQSDATFEEDSTFNRPQGGKLTFDEWVEKTSKIVNDDVFYLIDHVSSTGDANKIQSLVLLVRVLYAMRMFLETHMRIYKGFKAALEEGLSGKDDTDRYLSWAIRYTLEAAGCADRFFKALVESQKTSQVGHA